MSHGAAWRWERVLGSSEQVCEWVATDNRYVPYPTDEFQHKFTSVLSVRVDNAKQVQSDDKDSSRQQTTYNTTRPSDRTSDTIQRLEVGALL